MKLIISEVIQSLGIQPETCINWALEGFELKPTAKLPVKTRVSPGANDYINSMPCYSPELGRYSIKIVRRIIGGTPTNASVLVLMDAKSGEFLATMDATWLTIMRTAAVATLTIQTLRKKDAKRYAFFGLGNIAKAIMQFLIKTDGENEKEILLYRHKDQAEKFIDQYVGANGVKFEISDKPEAMIEDADVVVGCATNIEFQYADDSCYKEGVLIVPVHQKGFQNCDLFFDKIYGDDREGLEHYKYFKQWRWFGETGDMLLGNIPGRESESERIIAYNKGIGLLDLVFASKIYDMTKGIQLPEIDLFL